MYGVGVGMTFLERLHAKLEYEKIDLERRGRFQRVLADGTVAFLMPTSRWTTKARWPRSDGRSAGLS